MTARDDAMEYIAELEHYSMQDTKAGRILTALLAEHEALLARVEAVLSAAESEDEHDWLMAYNRLRESVRLLRVG